MVATASPKTAAVASLFPDVTVVERAERLSAGAARNLGRAQLGDIQALVFVDADVELGSGVIDRLVARANDSRWQATAARVCNASKGPIPWVRHLLEFKDACLGPMRRCEPFVPSTTLLVRADAFDSVGGFPDLWPGEDLVLSWNLLRAGKRIGYADEAQVLHHHPRGMGEMIAHQYRLGVTASVARSLIAAPTVSTKRRSIGQRFGRHPLLLVLARFARSAGWVIRYRPRSIARFVLLSPLIVGGLSGWSLGYARFERHGDDG